MRRDVFVVWPSENPAKWLILRLGSIEVRVDRMRVSVKRIRPMPPVRPVLTSLALPKIWPCDVHAKSLPGIPGLLALVTAEDCDSCEVEDD